MMPDIDFIEKTLNSQLVYDGKVLKVYKDDIKISTGQKSFREVVRHPGGIVIAALKDENKILMVKQFRYPISKAVYELPAGKLEKNEDVLFAAKRELEEETGYCAKSWKSLGYINTSPGFSDEKLYLFLAEELYYTKCHPDEGEIIQCFEFDIKVYKMISDGEINDSKTICGIFKCILEGVLKI